MAGENTYLESDGKAVTVTLTAAVEKNRVVYVEGWLGISGAAGGVGEAISVQVDRREYQFAVPEALAVAKGATVYVDVTDLTGHYPDETAYSTSTGSNKLPLFKATAAKDAANIVTGIFMGY